MISFIMMAKDTEKYLQAAIDPLLKEVESPWEIIIVDDHSSDGTYRAALEMSKNDSRLHVVENPHTGKVKGTSYAYTLARGDIIKCIDSDDVLLPAFFKFAKMHATHDVLFHSASIASEKLEHLATYHPNQRWLTGDFRAVAESLTSYPKWTWSFNRAIAEKVFPLPDDLPFEDVWMAIMLKRHAQKPGFTRESLYLYRQHENQTFGGMLNYSRKATKFRASRLLKLIDVLEVQPRLMEGPEKIDFTVTRVENRFLAGETGLLQTLKTRVSSVRKLRLVIQAFAPFLLKYLAIAQWNLAGKKSR